MRIEVAALLFGLLDGHVNAHASRSRTVMPELAFAVPPPPSGRQSPGGAWTGTSGRACTPVGRHGVCPLTSARRGKRPNKIATAAATKGASVRIEPLDGRSSSGGGGMIHRSHSKGNSRVPAPAARQQQKPKRARSPRKKAASSVAAAAAAVDPFPAGGSDFVAPLAGDGGSSSKATTEPMTTVRPRATAATAASRSASAAPGAERKSGSNATLGRGRTSAAGKAGRHSMSGRSSSSSATEPKAGKQRYGGLSARRAKVLRTRGRALFIICDAESITCPELAESVEILHELGTRNVGVVYADWKNYSLKDWRTEIFGRSRTQYFKFLQRDALPPGSNPLGDDTMTTHVVALARSEEFKRKKYEFCLVSADGSLAGLAARLRQEGAVVRGFGRRQAPEEFLQNCDSFMYIDPANRFELLDNEGLVISVALCIALAAAGLERCDWVRMNTIVKSLHAWDLGLEKPNYFGYSDYDEVVEAMDAYVTGVEDTSGEVVVKVPPKPKAGEMPRGLEDVATYLYKKWVSFTEDPRMNDILLACIPACLQALSAAREETDLAVRRFQRNDG